MLVPIIRLYQRLSIDRNLVLSRRTIRTSIIVIIVLSVIGYFSLSSSQSLNEQIGYVTSKIDSWQKYQEHQQEQELVSSSNITETSNTQLVDPIEEKKVRGVIVSVARNNDQSRMLETIRSVEERFNREFNYDWLIIADHSHSENFRRTTSAMTSANIIYHRVPKTSMTLPSGIDKSKMRDTRRKLKEKKISYGKSQKIKHIQRFWTHDIFDIDILQNYDYFLRIEPGSKLFCDINFDLFQFMKDNDKTYGFGFATKNDPNGVTTLWPNTLKFIEENPDLIHPNNMIDFITSDKGSEFNGCQLRAAFEIGSLRFFQSDKYNAFYNHFKNSHGIYYDNWEDSTYRTIALSLLVDREKIQFFNGLGYNDFAKNNHKSCPFEKSLRLKNKCTCNPSDDLTWNDNSCVDRFYEVNNVKIPDYVAIERETKRIEEEKAKKKSEREKYEKEQLEAEKAEELKESLRILEENKPEIEEQEGPVSDLRGEIKDEIDSKIDNDNE